MGASGGTRTHKPFAYRAIALPVELRWHILVQYNICILKIIENRFKRFSIQSRPRDLNPEHFAYDANALPLS